MEKIYCQGSSKRVKPKSYDDLYFSIFTTVETHFCVPRDWEGIGTMGYSWRESDGSWN